MPRRREAMGCAPRKSPLVVPGRRGAGPGDVPRPKLERIGLSPDGNWRVIAIPWWVSVSSREPVTWTSGVWDMTTGHVARGFPG
ncbi:MAG: hypothetical protein BIP78_0786 [Candidatus Bipolaricaulis sibiricus]|uniref:Uncharacterized protein n=1 Tax=Bipolaricaulis sibiricus TaxID=2501609 RepID=A0A410FU93_BIPS1|nr:MAG: hypothetical protein BIP78_0786 [Candidatus Bipolaricaulis sibiricus]